MIELRALTSSDLAACVDIHKVSFEKGWDAEALGEYIAPDAIAYGAHEAGALLGFIVMGIVTDQTDIITIAVIPQARGRGIGRKLVKAAEIEAAARGAEIIFLEVAEDNDDAIALYKHAGYRSIGKRQNYYRRAGGRVNAVTMRKDLIGTP